MRTIAATVSLFIIPPECVSHFEEETTENALYQMYAPSRIKQLARFSKKIDKPFRRGSGDSKTLWQLNGKSASSKVIITIDFSRALFYDVRALKFGRRGR
jgi:hypothetical protein